MIAKTMTILKNSDHNDYPFFKDKPCQLLADTADDTCYTVCHRADKA